MSERVAAGSERVEGTFADALFYGDVQQDEDGKAFDGVIGIIGEGRKEHFEEKASEKEDQGQAEEGYFERTIHVNGFQDKVRGLPGCLL